MLGIFCLQLLPIERLYFWVQLLKARTPPLPKLVSTDPPGQSISTTKCFAQPLLSKYCKRPAVSLMIIKAEARLTLYVQSALSDLLTTSATHGTFSRPSTKCGLILIGLELNTDARESFEHC